MVLPDRGAGCGAGPKIRQSPVPSVHRWRFGDSKTPREGQPGAGGKACLAASDGFRALIAASQPQDARHHRGLILTPSVKGRPWARLLPYCARFPTSAAEKTRCKTPRFLARWSPPALPIKLHRRATALASTGPPCWPRRCAGGGWRYGHKGVPAGVPVRRCRLPGSPEGLTSRPPPLSDSPRAPFRGTPSTTRPHSPGSRAAGTWFPPSGRLATWARPPHPTA